MKLKMKKKFIGQFLVGVMLVAVLGNFCKMKVEAANQPADLTFLSYCDENELAKWNDQLGYLDEKQADEIKSFVENYIVKGETDDYEKARLIFDWIYANVKYAHYTNEVPYINPYDIFIYRTAVCGGYSNLYKAMLNSVGIPSAVLGGNTLYGAHAWNAVCVNGNWFYSDSTWGGQYFDIGTDKFLQEHITYRVEHVSIETEDGLLLGYDMGVAVVGVAKNMTSINVPETYKGVDITSVSYQLFNKQYGIKELNVGKNVNDIANVYCETLEAINVSKENENYASKDGVLFSKDFTSLLIYPVEKKSESFILPKETVNLDLKETFKNNYLVNLEVEKGNGSFSSYEGALYDAAQKELLMVPLGKTEVYVPADAAISNIAFANADTSKMTIYSEEGSLAQKYALENNINFKTGKAPEENKELVTNVFEDVKPGVWYVASVQYVYDNGLMSGSGSLFKPTQNITRAQFVTILYKLAGSPKVTDTSALKVFSDVSKNQYYTDAICWAYATGVGSGNNGKFNIAGNMTRQQLAMFLLNFADKMGYDTKVRGDYSKMLNADQVYDYAKDAVSWAVGEGLISGSEKTDAFGNVVYDLKPRGYTTRAQVAVILQKFCEK